MERNVIMATRKTRSDCTVGAFEKKHGLPSGAIRNPNGKDAERIRNRNLRKDFANAKKNKK